MDNISELPEFILHHILSFLSHKQAIQTSALSKSWRHVGPTRPKIKLLLRQTCAFKKPGKPSSLSAVLSNTLQRYNHRNLPVQEFILEMSPTTGNQVIDSETISVLDEGIPMLLTNMGVKKFHFSVPHYVLAPSIVFRAEFLTDLCLSNCEFMTTTTTTTNDQPLFKGLKRLSLDYVIIENETLEKIMRTCPLIEYLHISRCVDGWTTQVALNLSIFQAEFLTELHLSGCKLLITTPSSSSSHDQPLFIKRLKSLSLQDVYILEETLEKIMCSCPLIECVLLSHCVRLQAAIQLNKFCSRQIKSLNLSKVRLSAELFQSFSSNFPSLYDLELRRCYGFQEIQLTTCSIKRLVIITDSTERLVITIYAPNIRYFELSGYFPPQLIFYTEAAREWKSRVVMLYEICTDNNVLPWLLQLSELLNSLSESQISLNVYSNRFKYLKVEDTSDARFYKPVPLEHVRVKGNYTKILEYVNILYIFSKYLVAIIISISSLLLGNLRLFGL